MKVRVAAARGLMAAGGALVLFAGAVGLGGAWLESRDRARLAARWESPLPVEGPARLVAEDLGILRLDRLGWSVIVRPTSSEYDLSRGAGWIPGTALPGEAGNTGIAGHRDTYFRVLRQVRRGDVFRLVTERGTGVYRVTKTFIVDPDDISILRPESDDSTLTLVTCYPFDLVGHAPKRFIVKAIKKGT
jgi:sortase A